MPRLTYEQRTEKALVGVHPDLVAVVRLAARYSPTTFVVTEGVRSPEHQRELVAIGASRTLDSRHLTGHAVDVVVIVDTRPSWHWPLYEALAVHFRRAAVELDVDIVWGGDWPTLRDGPHYELCRRRYPADGS